MTRRSDGTDHARQASSTSPEIGVLPLDPILTRRAEDVEIVRVLERGRLVGDIGRDDEDLARPHVVHLVALVAELQAKPALDDERDLLRHVGVAGDCYSFLYVDLCDHLPLAVESPLPETA